MTDDELDEKLLEMRANNVSIIEAIKFVRSEQQIDLGQAKEFVSQHPAYGEIHQAAQPLHDELIAYVEALDETAGLPDR